MQAKELDKLGRVVDFSIIKTTLCQWFEDNWDHRFLIWEEDPLSKTLKELDDSVVIVNFNPTAENLANYLLNVVGPSFFKDSDVKLIKVKVGETGKCSATSKL